MRAIVVVGMMVAAGAAWGQDRRTVEAAAGSIAMATVGGGWCDMRVNQPVAKQILERAGFKSGVAANEAALDRSFKEETDRWHILGSLSQASPLSKKTLDARCEQLWAAFGPEGLVRQGLLSKK